MVVRPTPSSWPISATVLSYCRYRVFAAWALERASFDRPLGRRQAGVGAFADDVALELGQQGKQVKHKPALGRGRVQVVL